MTKIAFIGAGSLGFTAGLVRDVLTFPLLRDAQIALMDINAERLEFTQTKVTKIIAQGKYPATVSATLDRAEALRDADVVLTMKRLNSLVMVHSAQKVRNGPNLDWFSHFDPAGNHFEEISRTKADELSMMAEDIAAR